MKTEVSFFSTIKNGENFIEQTINSIKNQTIEKWEYIIVDDGSTDKSVEIIQGFIKIDPRIRLIETGGVGRGKALNIAVENTKGKYIANIDVDDPCHYKRAAVQAKVLDEYERFSLVATESIFLNGNDTPDWTDINDCNMNVKIQDITIVKDRPFRKTPINHSSVMFRKKDLLDVGLYDEKRRYQFDYELWIRFSMHSYKIGLIPLKLSSKRMHSEQSFEIKGRAKYLKSSLKLKLSVVKHFKLSAKYYVYVYLKYFYGYIPKKLRKSIRMFIK